MAHGIEWILLVAAGFAAGAINAVAGGGSLLSFPALLAVGYGAVPANVTNSVALLPGFLGGSFAYRRELADQGARVAVLGAFGCSGAVLGAVLLLVGPDQLFRSLAPWLILVACVAMAARPLLRAHGRRQPRGLLWALTFLAGIYGGYFGAGLSIMLLALLGAFLPDDLHRLNALKGVLAFVVAVVTVLVVGVFGPVAWAPAGAMAAASLLGGHFGVGVARRIDEQVLRWAIIVYGVTVAILLLV